MGDSVPEASRSERWLVWAGLPLVVGASALFRVRDPDVWWRIKTGEWIWTHGCMPHPDPFSHTAQGLWSCVEPLANLLLFAVHVAFGPSALSWVGAIWAAWLALAAVALAREAIDEGPRLGPVVLAVSLCAGTCNFRFGPKPEVLSLVGLTLLLWLLHVVERRRDMRLVLLAPALILGWALLHRGSAVGLAALGAAALVWSVRLETRPVAWRAWAALAASVVALQLVPGSLSSSLSVVASSVYVEHLGEWTPLTLQMVWQAIPVLAILVVVWLLVAPVQRGFHFSTLVVLFTGVMALRHARFVPLFAVATMPQVAWGVARLAHRHRQALTRHVRPALATGLVLAGSLGIVVLPYLQRPVSTWGPGLHRFRRPVQAAAFLAKYPPPGRMFNTFNYGSYLLYALGPEQKVFIDGRNDQVYRPEFFAEASVAPHDPAVLRRLIRTYDVTYAVLECTKIVTTNYTWLYRNPDWRVVYLDDQAAILVKQTVQSREYLKRHAYYELSPDTALLRAQFPERDPRRSQFAREVFRNVEESPNSIRAHYLAALVYRSAGQVAAYRLERARISELAAQRRVDVHLP